MRLAAVAAVVAIGGSGLVAACVPVSEPPGPAVTGCAPLSSDTTTTPASTVTATPDHTVTVDVGHTAGAANRDLTGVVWNTGSTIAPDAPVHPAEVRIDASLQDRSLGPDQLDLTPLLDRVAATRAIGAEPLVLLSYMPRWLGAARAGTDKNPTRVGPSDLDAWQDLITTVVRTLATAPQPAYRFEVWNEPDLSIFWQDTPEEFVATALQTHQAVADVKQDTGLPLEVGGPAAALGPLSPNMRAYVQAVGAAGLPLDFISWHKYANFPYLGPDGPEGNLPPDLYAALAKRNPNSTPLQYSAEIATVRSQVAADLAGTGLSPRLTIDEWNVSAGGYDVRHDSNEGAALDAGILIEMEKAGLGGADFYRSTSGSANHPGDWGLTFSDGSPKPSWWVFRAWTLMSGARLLTGGDDPSHGLWARATRDRGCVSVLLANFVAIGAPAHDVAVHLLGALPECAGARETTLATLDGSSSMLATQQQVQLDDHQSATVSMPTQSVALLRVSCTSA
jgi:hypothetical protein